MKSKIKKIFIYALLLSLISCGSSGGNKDTEKHQHQHQSQSQQIQSQKDQVLQMFIITVKL